MPFELSESQIRLAVFVGVFVIMAIVEALLPRRERREARAGRWLTNFGIAALDSVTVLVLFPVVAVGAALWAEANGYGLFNIVEVHPAVAGILSFVLLDLAIYGQHVASHKFPVLWRLHRVHHADHDLDASSGIRFHPVEIVLSMVWKIIVVVALGAPAVAVFLFEVVLNGAAMFNHANVRIPLGVDGLMRLFIVTPDMHRVHHSIERRETDANYGFNLSLWDRIFGTYIAQPSKGHLGMTIGLPDQQGKGPSNLLWCLAFPFRDTPSQNADDTADPDETPQAFRQ